MPSSRGSTQPRDRTRISYVSYTGRRVLYHSGHLKAPSAFLSFLLSGSGDYVNVLGWVVSHCLLTYPRLTMGQEANKNSGVEGTWLIFK